MDDVLEVWRFFVSYEVLPVAGEGMDAQPVLFLQILDIMAKTKNYIESRDKEIREKRKLGK